MYLLSYCTVSPKPFGEYLQQRQAANSNCGVFDPRGRCWHGVPDPLSSTLQWPKQAALIHLEVPDPETHCNHSMHKPAGGLRFQIHTTMCPMVMSNNP